jgi:uncharacterized protein YigE (DUF2233 family)
MKFWLPVLLALGARAPAVEYREEKIGDVKITVCRVDVRKEHLQLFWGDEHGQPIGRFDKLAAWLLPQGQTLTFAMNAGMFQPSFAP